MSRFYLQLYMHTNIMCSDAEGSDQTLLIVILTFCEGLISVKLHISQK